MTTDEAYAALELPVGASRGEVEVAYRELVMKYHPDRNPGFEDLATQRLMEINAAHDLLISGVVQSAPEADTHAHDREDPGSANPVNAEGTTNPRTQHPPEPPRPTVASRPPMPQSSFFVLWSIVPGLNFMAWVHAALVTHRRKYRAYAVVFGLPWVALIVVAGLDSFLTAAMSQRVGSVAVGICLLSWIVGIPVALAQRDAVARGSSGVRAMSTEAKAWLVGVPLCGFFGTLAVVLLLVFAVETVAGQSVPRLEGMTRESAAALAKSRSLIVDEQGGSGSPDDVVCKQEPAAGDKAFKVTLSVAKSCPRRATPATSNAAVPATTTKDGLGRDEGVSGAVGEASSSAQPTLADNVAECEASHPARECDEFGHWIGCFVAVSSGADLCGSNAVAWCNSVGPTGSPGTDANCIAILERASPASETEATGCGGDSSVTQGPQDCEANKICEPYKARVDALAREVGLSDGATMSRRHARKLGRLLRDVAGQLEALRPRPDDLREGPALMRKAANLTDKMIRLAPTDVTDFDAFEAYEDAKERLGDTFSSLSSLGLNSCEFTDLP